MMKTNQNLILFLFAFLTMLLFQGCSLLYPFYGITERTNEDLNSQMRYLRSIKVDQTHLYDLSCDYYDSISMRKYAVNLHKLEDGINASVVQFRLYYPDGKLVTCWEQCLGDARELGYFDMVPMHPKFDHIPINNKLSLLDDLNIFDIDPWTKDEILQAAKEYDFVMILFWAEYAGVFTKRMFRDVYNYIEKDTEHTYLVLKLNTAKICK